jgi:hypothetical protein
MTTGINQNTTSSDTRFFILISSIQILLGGINCTSVLLHLRQRYHGYDD